VTYNKTLKRESGRKVMICIDFSTYGFEEFDKVGPEYKVRVFTKEKRKRKWLPVNDPDNYNRRRLDYDGRHLWDRKKQLEVVTEEEIYQAKLEAWETLKPKKV